MKIKQEKRGGLRDPSGGRPKKKRKRITVSVCLDPENADWLRSHGNDKNNVLNNILSDKKDESDNG